MRFIGKGERNGGWYDNCISLAMVCLLVLMCDAKTYHMEDFCGSKLSLITEKIYQLKLVLFYTSRQYPYTCEVKVETWYNSYRKLMFYFEDLTLDCNGGYLEFFVYRDKKTRVRVDALQSNICGHKKPVGVFTIDTRLLNINFFPARPVYRRLFSVIITAFRSDSCPSYAYQCKNYRCIDKDVACNEYDSCGDDSGCNFSTGAIVGIVIGSLAGVTLIAGLIVCVLCCRRGIKGRHSPQSVTASQLEMPLSNTPNTVNCLDSTTAAAETLHHPNLYVTLPPMHGSSEEQTDNIPEDPREQQTECEIPPPSYTELFGNSQLQGTHSQNSTAIT